MTILYGIIGTLLVALFINAGLHHAKFFDSGPSASRPQGPGAHYHK